ncbi:MAG: glycosyltransferase family 39 protein [Gaiellales bacterium]
MRHLRVLPVWLLLAGIVALSAGVRLWLVRSMVAPFIFVDELYYSELAKSLAEHGTFAIREEAIRGYSVTYPALIAPAWGLFDDGVTAYNVAKSINAVAMSLVAIPAYFLAVRVARPSLALLAAAIAVAIPSMAYTGTITTESLFYPVATLFALALVRYLETPSTRRLIMLFGSLALAYLTRSQAVTFVPVLVTVPFVLAAIRGRRTELRPHGPLIGILFGGGVLVLVAQLVRGKSPLDLLGAYAAVGEEGHYDVGEILRYWLWHVEELILYLAVVPVAAVAILVARGRSLSPRLQELVAATVALFAWSTLSVAMFSAGFADRIQDRYLFFLTPTLIAALVGWVELGGPRPRLVAPLAALGALGLTLIFPFSRFVIEGAKSDTLGLIPLWAFKEHLLGGSYWLTVAAVGGALVALFLLVRGRSVVAVPLVLLVLFALLSRPVWTSDKGFVVAGKGALFQGIAGAPRTWIDDAVDGRGEVVALWTKGADRLTINMNEFFNRSVGQVYYTVDPTPGAINEIPLSLDADLVAQPPDGVFNTPGDGVVHAPFALLDPSVDPDGLVVAKDKILGMRVWRLRGPLADRTTVTGLYPYPDSWSGPFVTWRRVRCAPGSLAVTVHSDPNLFAGTQTVTAANRLSGDLVLVSRRRIPVSTDRRTFTVPVRPGADGVCTVRFAARPTANPAKVIPGSTDDRVLGMHFDGFVYRPIVR